MTCPTAPRGPRSPRGRARPRPERPRRAATEDAASLRPRDVRAPLAVGEVQRHLRLADHDLVLLVVVVSVPGRDLPQRSPLLHLDPAKAADVLRHRGEEIAPEVRERARAAGTDGAR